jgi:lipopolysaccharide transport system permease protein
MEEQPLELREELHVRIKPSKGVIVPDLKELWKYRELLVFFVWRDLKVRYKQTVMGASWAIIQPVVTMVIFSVFFGGLAKMPSDGVPYPIFSFTALVPWTFFANGLLGAANSLVNNADMIRKIYFPRLTMPTAAVLSGLVDFALAFAVLIGMIIVYDRVPALNYDINLSANIIWLPFLLLLALGTTLGVSLWLSAMNAQFRDVRYAVPFLVQAWFFLTPVTYPTRLLSGPWQVVYALNPMAGVVEGFRWALLGTDTAPGPLIFVSSIAALVILVSGVFYFHKMEKTLADIV